MATKKKAMSKKALVEALAKKAGITKAATDKVLKALDEVVKKALKGGTAVTLGGLGKFESKKRAARTGRNPQTGKAIKIPAKNVPVFKASKGLKESV